ncbi:hypothetical protein [Streptomyces ehimensis]|uniref:Uncharacterized protein n=1 Tax=Streptomyces ehimensis TaxID=68195 RepID=A0ABV9BV10_9ACTN
MKRAAEWTVAITGGGSGGMGPIPGGLNIPGGPQPFQGGAAGVRGEPDPTGGRCLTKATAHGYAEIMKQWPEKS